MDDNVQKQNFRPQNKYNRSYSNIEHDNERNEFYRERNYRRHHTGSSSGDDYQQYQKDKDERYLDRVHNETSQDEEGGQKTKVFPSSSSSSSALQSSKQNIASSDQLDNIRGVSDEEDGELVDDEFDDMLTGCRRASWSNW